MRGRWLAGRGMRAAVAPLVLAAVLMGLGLGVAPASAGGLWGQVQPLGQGSAARALRGAAADWLCQDCFVVQHWDGTAWHPEEFSANPRIGYVLSSVAATSSRNAWAVGSYTTDFGGNTVEHTWIEHWDGTAWTRQASPNPGAPYMNLLGLSAVAATSATNAWAVGAYNQWVSSCCTGAGHNVILHWDGTRWAHVPAPNPGSPGRGDNSLSAVAATSADNAWAVGTSAIPEDAGGGGGRTVIVHWDGTAWTRVPSPNPGSESFLRGVAATSPTDAWAVGLFCTNRDACLGQRTLIEHWDGTAWTRVPSPSPRPRSALSGVAATSPTDAWAVGEVFYTNPDGSTKGKTLIEHWDGTAWTRVPSPSPGSSSSGLVSVAATSPADAWAVGNSYTTTGLKSVIEHWNGTAWTRLPSHNSPLYGVAATSPANAWAVGSGQRNLERRHTVTWNACACSDLSPTSPRPARSVNMHRASPPPGDRTRAERPLGERAL